MRTTIAAGPYDPAGARLLVRAYPEKSTVGIQIWTGKCEVIPQAERVAASIGQIDVFFNYDVKDNLLTDGLTPVKIETREGREEYVGLQGELYRRGVPVRDRLLAVYRRILPAGSPPDS